MGQREGETGRALSDDEQTKLRIPINSAPAPATTPGSKGVGESGPSRGEGSSVSSTAGFGASSPPPQFEPGTIIAGRYKIAGLIGRGGMGEVYRAQDQTLNQAVALKFLSAKYMVDPTHAQHLMNEVRIARRVSHPNVCRVHDVSMFQGQAFVSMELIEGEDLGTIIGRVGRLSGPRAISIAREMCIGLAAAHDQGVLHRDLKPANVLVDRDGHVHLADFGLSGLLVEGLGGRHRGGTPAYMPPEQLLGGAVGPRGDTFCLGLVLFELFTGKPVFRPKDMGELLDLHQKGVPPPSSVEPGIDPAVEHAIRWCLERSPDDRPESPLLVAAELPGGSLVAAALEAGLTLSPDLVASAGSKGVMRTSLTLAWLLAAVLFGILGIRLSRSTELAALVPMEKSTAVMADSARTILKKLGYVQTSPHEACAFDYYEELMSELTLRDPSPRWWDLLKKPRPSPIDFWYRRHVHPLVPHSPVKKVTWLDPAPVIPGMISLRLDPGGRLRELLVATSGIVASPDELTDPTVATLRETNTRPDPALLFEAAGLEPARFELTPTTWVPPTYCDELVSFAGVYPDNPGQAVTVNMGFFRGRPVSFRITETRLESASQFKQVPSGWQQNAGITIQLAIIILTTIGATFLARQNVMAQRSDREGGFRLSTAAFVLAFLSFLLRADHSAQFYAEAETFLAAVTYGVFFAATFLVFYLAVEPHARRQWPECLYAWSRLMQDRWTDPLVGQSLLVGGVGGIVALVLTQLHTLSPHWLGVQPGPPMAAPDYIAETLAGGRLSFGVALDFVVDALRFSLLYLTGIVLLVRLTRHRWLAIGIYATIHAVAWSLDVQTTWVSWIFGAAIAALATGVLVRFGMLALAVAAGTFLMLTGFPIQLDPSTWFFSSSLMAVGLVGACVGIGAATASGVFSKPAD